MKKLLIFLCVALALCFVLAACNEGDLDDILPPETDADATQKPAEGGEQTPPAHTHTWSAWVQTVAPTCQTKGVEARTCACGEDETREVEKTAHNLAHVSAKAASCTETGNAEYWTCNVCDKYFSNAAATNVIVDKTSVVIPATGHQSVTAHAAQTPTYTEAGNVAYWECEDCDTYFSDEACTTKIADKSSVILPVLAHTGTVTHHAATLATCENAGNVEYWSCDCCDKYFSNAGATDEIVDKASVVIPATGHEGATHHAPQAASCIAGNVEYWTCADCDTYFADAACTTKITDKLSVILPADRGCAYDVNNVCTVCNTALQYTEGLSYTLINGGAAYEVSGIGTATDTDVVIPYYYNQKLVTSIGISAFYRCSFGSITIPASVTSIGIGAFCACYSLTSITIPASVTSIGNSAFEGCDNLTSITIPASVTSIGFGAFYGCYSLTTVTFAANSQLTSIGNSAFYGCESLASITIPASVTSIGNSAFLGCDSLTSVTFAENSQLTSIGNSAFRDCDSLTSVTIPASVTSIGNSAFYGCESLASITIPASVTSIGYDAFRDCDSLTSITIPASVTSIGARAFCDCGSLESITVEAGNPVYHSTGNCLIETASGTLIVGCKNSVIPTDGSVTSIGNYAFYGCDSLTSITIPASVTSIGYYAFNGCDSLTTVTFAANSPLTSIGSGAFYGCESLTSITIPASMTSIGSGAFDGCDRLTTVTFAANSQLTSIGYGAFRNCNNLESITLPFVGDTLNGNSYTHFGYVFGASSYSSNNSYIPASLKTVIITGGTSIGYNAFYGCSNLTSITLPASVKSIGEFAFCDCNNLTTVTFAENSQLTSIGYAAFSDCSSLTTVTFAANSQLTSIGNYAFYGCESLASITIPASVTSIGGGAFDGCDSLTSITIPASVTSIGSGAFSGCNLLESITVAAGNTVYHSAGNCLIGTTSGTLIAGCKNSVIPTDGSVTWIGNGAFSGCESLTSITIPASVTSIAGYAFKNCDNLTRVTFAANSQLTGIGDSAFYCCSNLTSVTFPASVKGIGDSAFYGCSNLTSVTFPASVTSIGSDAFDGCDSLTTVTFAANSQLTSIGYGAFSYCGNLTSVTIPASVKRIGDDAFYGCENLTDVYFGGTEQQWNEIDFGDWENGALRNATIHYNWTN